MDMVGEQLALFGPPERLWLGGPHPLSLAQDDRPEGGAFLYEKCPEIFFGRRGVGPMRVAMDTSVLIDYAEFGGQIWTDKPFDPEVTDPKYRDELTALAEIMNLWMMRDIRLHVFERQLTDCHRVMPDGRAAMRERQIVQLQSALRCLDHDTVDIEPADGEIWPPPPQLQQLPDGPDRELVALAVEAGCHVFLTRDKGLLKKAEHLSPYWIALFSPTNLLDALAVSGEVGLTTVGSYLLPDSHKWSHVMGACGSSE